MKPFKIWCKLFGFNTKNWPELKQQHAEILMYFTMLSFITGLYSLIKWSSVGYTPLVITSIYCVISEIIAALLLAKSKLKTLATHLGFSGMVFHALNLIYQTGGVINSSQSFWISVLLVAFFLTTGHYIAWAWSILVILFCSVMILDHLNGQVLPNLILNTS